MVQTHTSQALTFKTRFRGFLPVVIDLETGGLDAHNCAILEIAMVLIEIDEMGKLAPGLTLSYNIKPHTKTQSLDSAKAIHGIEPDKLNRFEISEADAFSRLYLPIRKALKAHDCQRAILVGHNASFDLSFLNAANKRNHIKRNPFHAFSTFDTVSMSGLMFGETVLSKALTAAGFEFDEKQAHGALYDCRKTAELFCHIVNHFPITKHP